MNTFSFNGLRYFSGNFEEIKNTLTLKQIRRSLLIHSNLKPKSDNSALKLWFNNFTFNDSQTLKYKSPQAAFYSTCIIKIKVQENFRFLSRESQARDDERKKYFLIRFNVFLAFDVKYFVSHAPFRGISSVDSTLEFCFVARANSFHCFFKLNFQT